MPPWTRRSGNHPGYQEEEEEEEEEIARTISDSDDESACVPETGLQALVILAVIIVTHLPGAGTRGRRAVEENADWRPDWPKPLVRVSHEVTFLESTRRVPTSRA